MILTLQRCINSIIIIGTDLEVKIERIQKKRELNELLSDELNSVLRIVRDLDHAVSRKKYEEESKEEND